MAVADPTSGGGADVAAPARAAYEGWMTTTPMEPESDPQVVPSGDPAVNPVAPGEDPGAPIPEADPDRQ